VPPRRAPCRRTAASESGRAAPPAAQADRAGPVHAGPAA
jgi:hypothetical protein